MPGLPQASCGAPARRAAPAHRQRACPSYGAQRIVVRGAARSDPGPARADRRLLPGLERDRRRTLGDRAARRLSAARRRASGRAPYDRRFSYRRSSWQARLDHQPALARWACSRRSHRAGCATAGAAADDSRTATPRSHSSRARAQPRARAAAARRRRLARWAAARAARAAVDARRLARRVSTSGASATAYLFHRYKLTGSPSAPSRCRWLRRSWTGMRASTGARGRQRARPLPAAVAHRASTSTSGPPGVLNRDVLDLGDLGSST